MTREKAIEILRKNRPTSDPRPCGMELCEAVDMAISALRQQEHFRDITKKVEPLAPDELLKMDGEPVWVEFQDGSGGCWGLVHITVFTHIVFANGHFCTVGKPYYGKTWLAYRRKPEEGTV